LFDTTIYGISEAFSASAPTEGLVNLVFVEFRREKIWRLPVAPDFGEFNLFQFRHSGGGFF
jgi:hypothetical protein